MLPVKMSEPQYKIFSCRKQLILNMAGQRGGKSFGIGYRSIQMIRYFPHMIGMIAANTYKQLTQSTMVEVRKVWSDFFDVTEYDSQANVDGTYVINKKPPSHFKKFREFDDYDGIVSFRNGGIIFTASLDNYSAHEGKTLGWCELDETKDTKEEAVKLVILARLSQPGLYIDGEDLVYFPTILGNLKSFNPCIINTSPAEGVVDWLIDMFDLKNYEEEIVNTIFDPYKYFYKENGIKAVCIYSTYWNAHNLRSGYVEDRIEQLTKGEADKFVFGYPFAKSGGEYFDYFDRKVHVRPTERYSHLSDHLCYDFNLVPYMTLVNFQIQETDTEFQIRFYREYCLKPPLNTTESVTEAFILEFGDFIQDLYFYGDAMGTRGVEGLGDTYTRFNPVRDKLERWIYPDSDRTMRRNYGVMARRNLVNKILAGKLFIGNRRVTIYIDPSCENLIRDMQFLKLGKDGKLKELVTDKATGRKYEKLGHTSDAIEYGISYLLSEYL